MPSWPPRSLPAARMRKANPKALNLRARSNRTARALTPSRNPPATPPPRRRPAARARALEAARSRPARTRLNPTPMPPAEGPPGEQWAAQRSAAASEHLARLEARQDAEHRRAEGHLAAFIHAARAADLAAEPLRMQGYNGGRSARTPLRGWYLRKDRKAGIDTDGNFYLLARPLGVLDVLRGAAPRASRPPLVLGAGGRDGDSVELTDALERLLPGWRELSPDFPSGRGDGA